MTLHLVYEKARVPSTRIRLVQMAPHLEARGLPCRLSAYPTEPPARSTFEAELAPGDVALIHRARPSPAEMRWWRSLPIRCIYDFDDLVMRGRRRGWRGRLASRRRAAGFRRALAISDAASCGNAFLAAQCGELPTAVIPSAVASDVPRHVPRPDPRPLRIGWVGRSSNLGYVRELADAFARLSSQRPVVFVCVSDAPLTLRGCPVENVAWNLDTEAAAVAGFDVGVMPLALDDPWSRGKCAYKLLQYMAAGVPAVGSDVGMNADLIAPGRNGFLARSSDDWVDVLGRLADDFELRARIGAAGRATVEAEYSYDAVADALAGLVARVAGSDPGNIASR